MAPTIREVLVIPNGSTTARTVTTSVGTLAGDTFVIIQGTDNNTVAGPTCTAGTPVQHGTSETDGNGNGVLRVYTLDASAGGAQDVTFPAAGGFDIFGIVLVMSGTATPDGFAKTNFPSSATSFVTPSATVAGVADLLVVAGFGLANTTLDFAGSGLTERAQNTALPFSFCAAGTAELSASGPSPTYTVTTGASAKPGFIVFGLAGSAANEVIGTASAPLGALVATATGVRTVIGTATAPLGGLVSSFAGQRTVIGTATAPLGGLTASMTVGQSVPLVSVLDTAQNVLMSVTGVTVHRLASVT